MKRINDHYYPGITNFEDFRLEKQRLILRSKLIEAKINMEIIMIREVFSISSLVFSFAKEFILPKITGMFEDILKRSDTDKE
jgi:hypothetical protein